MASRSIGWSCVALVSLAAIPATAAPASSTATAVIQRYCIGCHNAKLKTAGLVLDAADLERIGDHPVVWEKVARKLRTGEMPPAGMPRPDKAAYAGAAAELETALDAVAAAKPSPGRV